MNAVNPLQWLWWPSPRHRSRPGRRSSTFRIFNWLTATAWIWVLALQVAAGPAPEWRPLPRRSTPVSRAPEKGAVALAQATRKPDGPAPTAIPQPVRSIQNATDVTDATPAEENKPAVVRLTRGSEPVTNEVNGRKLYSFRATDLDLKAALAMFARANNLTSLCPTRMSPGK